MALTTSVHTGITPTDSSSVPCRAKPPGNAFASTACVTRSTPGRRSIELLLHLAGSERGPVKPHRTRPILRCLHRLDLMRSVGQDDGDPLRLLWQFGTKYVVNITLALDLLPPLKPSPVTARHST